VALLRRQPAVTHSRRDIVELLERLGSSPKKSLGQNFVADPNLVRRIARESEVGPGDYVVEVGPGLGSLTLALEETGARVLAVEIDRAFAGLLPSIVQSPRTTVIEADALDLGWAAQIPSDSVLVANLPYNIATPLILDVLDHVPAITRMVVMVQREVADRLVARVGDEAYGIPSVKVAYWAGARTIMRVPPDVFYPRPNVDSAVVRIERKQAVADVDRTVLFELVRKSFGQRRKMLRRSLAGLVTEAQFDNAGVRPEQRPEELDVEVWCRLAAAVAACVD